jgi:3'-5' exoribonuclease
MITRQQNEVLIGQRLSGEFTIKNPSYRVTRKNSSYLIFDLKTDLSPVKAIAWEESCNGMNKLWHGQNIQLEGLWEQFNGLWQVKCLSIKYTNKQAQEIAQAKIRLRALFAWLPDRLLKKFVIQILNDEGIAKDFSESPASLNHHHAFFGGLLVHSVDVAWQVFNQHRIPDQERYLGVVAGLFHDLGKIKTLSPDMKRSQLGVLVDHEQLTLEVLSPHLRWLDSQDPKLSVALRNLLCWKPRGFDRIPKFEVYEVIKMADRVSAGSGHVKCLINN